MVLALMMATCDRRMERARVKGRRFIREREKDPRVGKGARGDDAVERNGEKDRRRTEEGDGVYEYGITYVRPEQDAVVIVNRRMVERRETGEMKRRGREANAFS